jgi:phosphate/phosphite/phosphonate ABC transporter binding protein
MKEMRYRLLCWTVFITVGALCLFLSARNGGAAEAKDATGTLTLGLVSEVNRSAIERHFAAFVSYVARKASAAPALQGKVVVAATVFELAKLLEQRKVDFYLESPYPTYVINDVHGAGKLLLRRWKGGVAEYYSVIFTRSEGGLRRLDDLRGNTIAFEDPSSTSGYLLPKLFLARAGFKLIEKARFDPHASNTEVRFVFAYSQNKLVDWVLTKQVDAGAFSSEDLAQLDNQKKAAIAVLAQTERLPRHLVSVRVDLAPQLAKRLEGVLLGMDGDEEGRRILNQTDQTTKFDLLPGGDEAMRRRLLDTFVAPQR